MRPSAEGKPVVGFRRLTDPELDSVSFTDLRVSKLKVLTRSATAELKWSFFSKRPLNQSSTSTRIHDFFTAQHRVAAIERAVERYYREVALSFVGIGERIRHDLEAHLKGLAATNKSERDRLRTNWP